MRHAPWFPVEATVDEGDCVHTASSLQSLPVRSVSVSIDSSHRRVHSAHRARGLRYDRLVFFRAAPPHFLVIYSRLRRRPHVRYLTKPIRLRRGADATAEIVDRTLALMPDMTCST